jgi:hypothetical protein
MGDLFKKIRRVVNEEKIDPKLLVSLTDPSTFTAETEKLKSGFEKIVKTSGFGKSFNRVNMIGHGKMMVYYSDADEAKKFESWAKKEFANTKVGISYKDLSVDHSNAGVVFDFNRV